MTDLVIGCDHAAFEAKDFVVQKLKDRFNLIDVGTNSNERCNYPEFAFRAVQKIAERKCLGILLCGSGIGISMAANRFQGIRAALCRSIEEAQLSKQHNNANILCLGGRITPQEQLIPIIDAWLVATFEGGRHTDRVAMFDSLGEKPRTV